MWLCLANLNIIFISCNETFVPLQDRSESPFSMYGYLDASADTQWVRVIPVRQQLDTPAEIPEMSVTIENLETGDRAEMMDSLFQLRQGFNIINSWSTLDIQPNQTYQLQGELPNGLFSTASITTPEDFPQPNIDAFNSGCSGRLRISGVERLADVKSVWRIRFYFGGREDLRVITIPYRRQVLDLTDGDYSVGIDTNKELSTIADETLTTPDSLDVLSRKIFIASAGPDWDEDLLSLEQLEYALPLVNSNVENGVGYMIGIVSKTIDLTHCSSI
jgi:hypothetical protein